ncbi:MAG: flagellar motor protein MotB [Aquimonas sp.]|nr:flagellar motor protein MotB [Aquimonas sp.]
MADSAQPIIIKRVKKVEGGHHGGAWKVAYADFVTAMMAFFLVMWLVATLPEEKLSGISEYFKNPSVLRGAAQAPPPAAMGAGGGGVNPVTLGPTNISPTMDGEGRQIGADGRALDAEQAKKLAAEQDRRELQELKLELEAAIERSQALEPFKDQLLLDITPEGLRIQIVDEQNRPMFDVGSAILKPYTRDILRELTPYIDNVERSISLSGHTDATPFGGAGVRGYSNWELSADRANAARRELVAAGLPQDKVSRVVGLSSSVLFDRDNPTNPINRRISIIVMTREAEASARELESFGTSGEAEPAEESTPPPDIRPPLPGIGIQQDLDQAGVASAPRN